MRASMRVVVQRVTQAAVSAQGLWETIKKGLVVLVAIANEDSETDAKYLAAKIANLRIMNDEDRKIEKTLKDIKGEILVIPQFTLYGETRKGNRPDFTQAAPRGEALKLYEEFVKSLRLQGLPVKTGTFGEYMTVALTGDGPVTIIIDSSQKQSVDN